MGLIVRYTRHEVIVELREKKRERLPVVPLCIY